MALIVNGSVGPAVLSDKQRETKKRLQQICTSCFNTMKNSYNNGMALLNENPYGLTKEQVIAGLGEDAAQLSVFGELLANTLNTAVPGTIVAGGTSSSSSGD